MQKLFYRKLIKKNDESLLCDCDLLQSYYFSNTAMVGESISNPPTTAVSQGVCSVSSVPHLVVTSAVFSISLMTRLFGSAGMDWTSYPQSHSMPQRPQTSLISHTSRLIDRSEEHTSELQSRPHISYAVFCLKKKTYKYDHASTND